MKFLRNSIILIFFISVSSCQKISGESPLVLDPSDRVQSMRSGLDFEFVKANVFLPRCTVCHSQYNDYANVIEEIKTIERVVESDQMPKSGGPLNPQQKEILKMWIASGLSNRQDAPPAGSPDLEPNWKSVSTKILFPKCLACHNPNGQAKFLDLSNRQALYASRNRVFAGGAKLLDLESPEKSYLIQILKDPDEPMPPLYSKIERLTDEQITFFQRWIGLGLP